MFALFGFLLLLCANPRPRRRGVGDGVGIECGTDGEVVVGGVRDRRDDGRWVVVQLGGGGGDSAAGVAQVGRGGEEIVERAHATAFGDLCQLAVENAVENVRHRCAS